MRRYPDLYEINTRIFLSRLTEKYGQRVTLASIPDEEWKSLAEPGFDLIWLMGVWQRSPATRLSALQNPGLRQEYNLALPGWTEEDVSGSPYAVYSYHVDPAIGTDDDLAALKTRLNRLGTGLILDFVPNHLALDHPWTQTHPERFVCGNTAEIEKHPDWFYTAGSGIYLAHGRDPYFAPWDDTVQVNFYSDSLRQAFYSELERLSDYCDGLRCDMAMLALNSVFEQVWGGVVGETRIPESEFWGEAISRLRKKHPGFLFIAEAYWGLNSRLREQGFDFTYDKPLYDHLLHGNADEITDYITSEKGEIGTKVHFIENHDESRAVTAFGKDKSMAAAVVTATLPGLSFYQYGQLEGRKTRTPVQLTRELTETIDAELSAFYQRLRSAAGANIFHEGSWKVVGKDPAWEGNNSHHNLLAWEWEWGSRRILIVVNYSVVHAQGWIKPAPEYGQSKNIMWRDKLSNEEYIRYSDELNGKGLYIDLKPFQFHFLESENR